MGAINAAKWGKTYKEILAFYYPGAKLTISRPAILERLKTLIKKIMAKL